MFYGRMTTTAVQGASNAPAMEEHHWCRLVIKPQNPICHRDQDTLTDLQTLVPHPVLQDKVMTSILDSCFANFGAGSDPKPKPKPKPQPTDIGTTCTYVSLISGVVDSR